MINIILCGGSGTRLWPISRKLMPKQFVKLFDEKSLFQMTVERNEAVCAEQYVVSNTDQYFLAVDQLEELGVSRSKFLLEPIGRNTAPAIALAAMSLDENAVMLVTPSDHLIQNLDAYHGVLSRAETLAAEGNLVTFGIKPGYPETGYGYIEASGEAVMSFKEKPDAKTAQQYVDSGNYYWNSGMFCFKAGIFLNELQVHAPEIFKACRNAFDRAKDGDMIRIDYDDMAAIAEESIDYAVMEKSSIVKVVPADIGWSDLGSFDALSDAMDIGTSSGERSDRIEIDSSNNMILSNKLVATIDCDDLIVVDTDDALLITKKGSSQKVKEVVNTLNARASELPNTHLTVHRPWGRYTVLEEAPGYKIKKIEVKPGKRLSLQKHFHRNEHWIVLSGTATVTVGEQCSLVRPNESTYIKAGEIHRLANEGTIPLVIIEAQVGEYTGEDDIVRLDDDFAR